MGAIILCNISDAIEVISEAREAWIVEILTSLGVDEELLEISKKDIQKFRYYMEELGIEIDFKTSGEIDIYKKKWHEDKDPERCGWLPTKKEHLIAQWKEPEKIRKIEGKEVFYEIHLSNWSMVSSRL